MRYLQFKVLYLKTVHFIADFASGTTIDYIKGTYNKRFVYVYELRDHGRHGFLLPPDQIIPSGEETLDSLVAIFKEIKTFENSKKKIYFDKLDLR